MLKLIRNRIFNKQYISIDNGVEGVEGVKVVETTNVVDNTVDAVQTVTTSQDLSNQRYKKGHNINVEASNVMKYKNFKWPKKDENWTNLLTAINTELSNFQEDDDVNTTIVKLRDTIVKICEKKLSRKQKRKELPERVKLRDSLIKEV